MQNPLGGVFEALKRNKFGTNVAILTGGTAAGQIIMVAASPVLTRLFSPEEFGIFSVYASLLSVLAGIVSLRYEMAIPLSSDDKQASSLVVLSVFLVLVSSVILAAVIEFGGQGFARWMGTPNLYPFIRFLPISVAGMGCLQVLNYWAVRQSKFHDIATAKVSQSVGQVLTQVGVGFVVPGHLGLIVGDVVGRLCAVGVLAVRTWHDLGRYLRSISWATIVEAADRYKRFPMISSWSGLLNSAGLHLPPVLFAFYYGPQVAGWVGLGQRVIGIPIVLVGQSVADVYMGEASRLIREPRGELQKLFLKTSRNAFLLGLVPSIIFILLGPWSFRVIFGPEWNEAGVYVSILALMFLVRFSVVPISRSLLVLEKQEWQMAWDIGRAAAVLGGIVAAGALGYSARIAVIVFGSTMLLSYVAHWILVVIALKREGEMA